MFKDGIFRLVDKKALLQFGEFDIHTLAAHQILCDQETMEASAKEFTNMISEIIKKKMWVGAMGKSDVLVIEKDRIYASSNQGGHCQVTFCWFGLGINLYRF